jgi:hypothetical protein
LFDEHEKFADKLLDSGANRNVIDKNGKKPLDYLANKE